MKNNFLKTKQNTCMLRNIFTVIFFSAFFSLSLSSCNQTAKSPKDIANQYWQHLQTGNTVDAEKLATTDSQQTISAHKQRIANITKLENGETKTTVHTTITTINPKTNHTYSQNFETVLVLEQGQWKVDTSATQIPSAPGAQREKFEKLADELSRSMQKNIESIDEAVNEGMDMLNEKLHESSKEMGGSLLDMMKDLNESMRESIDKMKKQSNPTQGQNEKGEGKL